MNTLLEGPGTKVRTGTMNNKLSPACPHFERDQQYDFCNERHKHRTDEKSKK